MQLFDVQLPVSPVDDRKPVIAPASQPGQASPGEKPDLSSTMKAPLVDRAADYKEPIRFESKEKIDDLLRECVRHKPSDIYITTGHPVLIKINGSLQRVTTKVLDESEFKVVMSTLRQKVDSSAADILKSQDFDNSYSVVTEKTQHSAKRVRFRNNFTGLYAAKGGGNAYQAVLRVISETPPRPEDIGLTSELLNALTPPDGAVYIVGPTGSGKSTTFGSLMRWIAEGNSIYYGVAHTYEAPVEYDLQSLSSARMLITQVEVGSTSGIQSFPDGVRNAMRRAPDLAMIGEMRDAETILAGLEFAATGHPLFTTLHANGVADTVPRLLKRIPPGEKESALADILSTTRAILFQRLVPSARGGRVALREWLCLNDEMRAKLQSEATTVNVGTLMRKLLDEFGHSLLKDASEHLAKENISQEVFDAITKSMHAPENTDK